jgi:hypothetical protein
MSDLHFYFDEPTRNKMGFCSSPEQAQQGAATPVIAAVGNEWEGVEGKIFEDC